MFDAVEARFALRSFFVGVATSVAVLQAAGFDSWPNAILSGVAGALSYAGVGAIVPQVEPSIGNKRDANA